MVGTRHQGFWRSLLGRVLVSLAISIVLCAVYVVIVVRNSEMEFRPLTLLIFLSGTVGVYLRHRLKM